MPMVSWNTNFSTPRRLENVVMLPPNEEPSPPPFPWMAISPISEMETIICKMIPMVDMIHSYLIQSRTSIIPLIQKAVMAYVASIPNSMDGTVIQGRATPENVHECMDISGNTRLRE